MQDTETRAAPATLSAEQVAWRLFEEARLAGWRSHGLEGLTPIQDGDRFRPQDVEAFIAAKLRAA